MRIATWNLERPRPKRQPKLKGLKDQFAKIDADIWLLTETSEHACPGGEYLGFHTTAIDGYHTPGERRAAIWSRLPIRQQIATHDDETAVCVEIETPIGPLIAFATVIPYHLAGSRFRYRSNHERFQGLGTWELHKASIERHGVDWNQLRQQYPNSHFCVGGDFNQHRDGQGRYGNRAVRTALTAGLKQAGLVCATEEDFRATGKLQSKSTVDHICLDSELTALIDDVGAWEAGADDNGKRLSDHSGVWVDLNASPLMPNH